MSENKYLFGEVVESNPLLRDRFMEPPFSILNTKGKLWQARKRQWKTLGIKSEVGRDAECNAKFDDDVDPKTGLNKYGRKPMSGVSIFDPALCELMYNWYCKDGGVILDPFAGGSVRGIIANYLGYNYTGIDIRQEQVDSNREQAIDILPVNRQPEWYVGDSNEVLDGLNIKADLIFSCPPYADLEVYSDLKGDISNMEYNKFMEAYESIIAKSCGLLKKGGYACFVVGEVRNKKGNYIGFVPDTIRAFEKAGVKYYNEGILLNAVASASMRADKQFSAGKKLVKIHQNVLIFKKY